MGWLRQPQARSRQTEAGTCASGECWRTAFRGRPLSAINTAYAQGEGSMPEAIAHFELFAKNNAQCRPAPGQEKYGLISDLSKGVDNNLTWLVKVDAQGEVTYMDSFQTAEGKGNPGQGGGIGNTCDSNKSPHGFMMMGPSDFRSDVTPGYYPWPQCGDLNPGFKHNRIYLAGLEIGYNNNLGGEPPGTGMACPDGMYRDARLHSIVYLPGGTSLGCKGMTLDKWCKWAPKLSGGCVYNYDGSDSPAICRLKGGSEEACKRPVELPLTS